MLKACKECNLLTERSECPLCQSDVSKDWQGYVIIIDYKRSAIARRMNIRSNGRYALKVR